MSAQGDCEFLVQRARELVQQDLWAAKAWLITARSLYPADLNIQVRSGRARRRLPGGAILRRRGAAGGSVAACRPARVSFSSLPAPLYTPPPSSTPFPSLLPANPASTWRWRSGVVGGKEGCALQLCIPDVTSAPLGKPTRSFHSS